MTLSPREFRRKYQKKLSEKSSFPSELDKEHGRLTDFCYGPSYFNYNGMKCESKNDDSDGSNANVLTQSSEEENKSDQRYRSEMEHEAKRCPSLEDKAVISEAKKISESFSLDAKLIKDFDVQSSVYSEAQTYDCSSVHLSNNRLQSRSSSHSGARSVDDESSLYSEAKTFEYCPSVCSTQYSDVNSSSSFTNDTPEVREARRQEQIILESKRQEKALRDAKIQELETLKAKKIQTEKEKKMKVEKILSNTNNLADLGFSKLLEKKSSVAYSSCETNHMVDNSKRWKKPPMFNERLSHSPHAIESGGFKSRKENREMQDYEFGPQLSSAIF